MSFPEDVVLEAWRRARGRCQCKRRSHSHIFPHCDRRLLWENQKDGDESPHSWFAYHKDHESDNDTLANCEILCWSCSRLA